MNKQLFCNEAVKPVKGKTMTNEQTATKHMASENIALEKIATIEKEVMALRDQAGQVSTMLKQLANPDRLLILCQLAEQEFNVSQIEQLTGIMQPTLSQQLTILRRAKLVTTRREGKQIYYAIQDERLMRLLQTLYQLYCH